jgi:alanyl-tRNA synthetase
MTSAQIRQSFLDFFREKQHTIVPSSSLLPDAANLLFTNAGMNQFVPIFLGQQKPAWNPARGRRENTFVPAANITISRMSGSTPITHLFRNARQLELWRLFQEGSDRWAWELLVDRWKFPAQRLYATVYKLVPEPSEFDREAHDHWAPYFATPISIPIHIVNGGKADNFWMMGDTGRAVPARRYMPILRRMATRRSL